MAPARLDLIGLGLLGILAAWVLLSAELEGGDPRDYLGMLGLLACGYLAGRLSARWAWIVATVVAVGFGTLILATPDALAGGPLAGPLGYANANGALAVQVAAILLVAATRTKPTVGRVLLMAAAVPTFSLAWFNKSSAAMLGGGALLLVGLVAVTARPRRSLLAISGCGLIVAVAVIGQMLVATGTGDSRVASLVTERRVELWTDAIHLAWSAPLTGYGPHSFSTKSPTAASDPDTRAAHSAVLQVAAETGLVGASLVLLLVAWAFVALGWTSAQPGLVGAVAWTAFCLQALVDYVANFPLVVATASLALGLAVGPYWRDQAKGSHRRHNNLMSPAVSDQAANPG